MTSPVFSEAKRQIVHITMVGWALLLKYLTLWQAIALALAAIIFNRFILPRFGGEQIARAGKGYDPGLLAYPFSVLLLLLFFGKQMHIVAAAWAIMACGDGFATLIGSKFGRLRLPWNPDKSFAGLAAFAFFGSLSAAFFAFWIRWGSEPITMSLLLVPAAAALVAALVETLPIKVNDNLTVPLASAALMYTLYLVRWGDLDLTAYDRNFRTGLVVTGILGVSTLALRWVTWSGFISGLLIGTLTYTFLGYEGFSILATFFILGSILTKLRVKFANPSSAEEGGRRGWREALANCSLGVHFAFLASATAHSDLFRLAFTAAFATAAADTVSGEFGQLIEARPLLITDFKPVPVGTDGAISLAGTLAGMAAALFISWLALFFGLISSSDLAIVNLAALIGNFSDSLLGATLERRGLINNQVVNFANTAVGSGIAMLIYKLLSIR